MPFSTTLPDPKQIRKILILGHSNIGDIGLDTFFLKPLRQYYPQAQVDLMTSTKAKDLVGCYKGIDHAIIVDKKGRHKGFWGQWRLHRELKAQRYDLIIVLVKTFRHVFLGAKHVWDVRRIHEADFKGKAKHPLDVYMKFLSSLGMDVKRPEFDFDLEGESDFCAEFLKRQGIKAGEPVIGILPLAAWGLKNWPIEKWNELAKILKERYGIKMIAFGKTSGDQIGANVVKSISPEIISAIDRLTLKQSLKMITLCRIFAGPDSSLLHLASNLGVESIGLYGPTPPDYVYPYFHRKNLILPKNVPAQYCCSRDQHRCACRDGLRPGWCMFSISVDEVLNAILSKIRRLNR